MSAISFSGNYVSSSYYAAAKRQSAAVTETNNNSNLETSSSAGDVLTISAEALEVLNNSGGVLTVSAEELEGSNESPRIEELKPKRTLEEIAQERSAKRHSNHQYLGSWALGITSNYDERPREASTLDFMDSKYQKYSKYQSNLENADETFTEMLKRNCIQLSDNEHIELTIDYDGNVIVGGNISKEKAGNIQSILINNKSFVPDLMSAHGCRKSIEDGYYSSDTERLILSVILQREYGLSLSDFEINENFDLESLDENELNIKNGNTALLESMYENEASLASEIFMLLLKQENNPDAAPLPSVTFSYQNGVFVEKGVNDATTLNSFASKVMWNAVDYSMTFDDNGRITNIKETSANAKSGSLNFALSYNRASFDKDTWVRNGAYFNSETLRQYVFDRKRLIKYETGKEADVDTFTVGKDEKGSFSIAVNSNALYNIAKSQSTT
jgi:hypothetical protein